MYNCVAYIIRYGRTSTDNKIIDISLCSYRNMLDNITSMKVRAKSEIVPRASSSMVAFGAIVMKFMASVIAGRVLRCSNTTTCGANMNGKNMTRKRICDRYVGNDRKSNIEPMTTVRTIISKSSRKTLATYEEGLKDIGQVPRQKRVLKLN